MKGFPDIARPCHVHFVGIGGVGMAGLARLLVQGGFQVSGSDGCANRLTDALVGMGVHFFEGHRISNVSEEIDWAVRTPAVAEDNPEVVGLRGRGIPVFRRGDILAAYSRSRKTIAVAGAHGKTTTSAMLAWILRERGLACGYAIGGETALPGVVADAGDADVFVCEADESDGTLVRYTPDTTILTHVEWDHPERFPTEASLWACYESCIRQSGRIWIREDDEVAVRLTRGHPALKTIGCSDAADLQLLTQVNDPEGQELRLRSGDLDVTGRLSLPGLHNAWNAMMALGVAQDLGISMEQGLAALSGFPSVGRRFERVDVGGVTVIQDYAHHPTEIRAVMRSVQALNPKRLWIAFQPHRYSRTQRLLQGFAESFSGAERLDLLPVYAAFELPEQGADSAQLAAACRKVCGEVPVRLWSGRAELARNLADSSQPGDVLLILGAGDIGQLQREVESFLMQKTCPMEE
jgi:UDP-N-acetylmuramate--alanine ligase